MFLAKVTEVAEKGVLSIKLFSSIKENYLLFSA
jgi:hypothetical protein